MRHEPDPVEAFKSMLEALRNDGMGPSQIARETGLSRPTVWRLINGEVKSPSYATGHAVEKLYRERRR